MSLSAATTRAAQLAKITGSAYDVCLVGKDYRVCPHGNHSNPVDTIHPEDNETEKFVSSVELAFRDR